MSFERVDEIVQAAISLARAAPGPAQQAQVFRLFRLLVPMLPATAIEARREGWHVWVAGVCQNCGAKNTKKKQREGCPGHTENTRPSATHEPSEIGTVSILDIE